MTSVTYQTLVPSELTEFCEAMAQLFSQIEKDLYQAISREESLNDLKRSYQLKSGINARQFNSIRASIKGKISSRLQCHQRQLSELKLKISALEKSIKAKVKKLKKTAPSCGLGRNRSLKSQLRFSLHQKRRQLVRLRDKLASLSRDKPSLIFGGYKLWKAQFNLEENGYKAHEQWRDDWRQRRNSQFMLVGSKDETAGCQNCQLSDEGNLKIRVPYVLTSEVVIASFPEMRPSIVEVTLSDESPQATVGTGSRGSPSDTSAPGRDSSARADKTARSAAA